MFKNNFSSVYVIYQNPIDSQKNEIIQFKDKKWKNQPIKIQAH